jgi:hypothetical protein
MRNESNKKSFLLAGVIELQGRVVVNANNVNGRNSCPCTCCQSGCNKGPDQPANPVSNPVLSGNGAAVIPAESAPLPPQQQRLQNLTQQQQINSQPNHQSEAPTNNAQVIAQNDPPKYHQVNPEIDSRETTEDPGSPSVQVSSPTSSASKSPDIPDIPAPELPPLFLSLEPKSTQTSPTKSTQTSPTKPPSTSPTKPKPKPTSNSSTQTLNNFAVTLISAANLPPLSLTQEVPDVAL